MADHPVQTSVIVAYTSLLRHALMVVLCTPGPHHLSPSHQNHHVTYVGYVGDCPQWQVH